MTDEPNFPNILAVLAYLHEEGWKVSQAGLYKHRREGKIRPGPDGGYLQKDADRYAKTWLKQQSTGTTKQGKIDQLQRLKLEKELDKLDMENARSQLKMEAEQGRYILRSEVELDQAAKAGIFDAGLNHWIRTNAADWIALTAGDTNKTGELIAAMLTGKDELLNHYATMRDYIVEFVEGEENEDEETEDRSQETGKHDVT